MQVFCNLLSTVLASAAAASAFISSPPPAHRRRPSMMAKEGVVVCSSSSSTSVENSNNWYPGTDILNIDPSILCKAEDREGVEGNENEIGNNNKRRRRPQLAKDEEYASAIIKAWREEIIDSDGDGSDVMAGYSMSSPLVYKCKSDGNGNDDDDDDNELLYGHIYRSATSPTTTKNKHRAAVEKSLLPGIILFHTGAGPQDIFLRWKADSLVNEWKVFGNGNDRHDGTCVVLIADILGDSNGWAWNDRSRYDIVRRSILVPDVNGERKRLQSRVQAAVDAISSQPDVDSNRLAAFGFCLGGHPIVELARIQNPSVRAMVTFHGVFDGLKDLSSVVTADDDSSISSTKDAHVLVCTGKDDPFTPIEDVTAAMTMFTELGYQTKLMNFANTRHGFTNPAQDSNPNESFAYNEETSKLAWEAALALLKSTLMDE